MLHAYSFTYHRRCIMLFSRYFIPPMFHTHSFTYHRRCMFFSRYVSFPCQYHSTIASYSFIYHRRSIMFFSQYFSFPCQYHFANAPYSFIHLPATMYNVFLPILQFSPVSIIPLMLHTHSFTYHRRCIMFLFPIRQFPLSVSFHQCSVLIHSSTTDAL